MSNRNADVKLSHVDDQGRLAMVNVGDKAETQRIARAESVVRMQPATLDQVISNDVAKGDVLTVARIAGIQAAKQCGQLIPLCHPLGLDHVSVEIEVVSPDRLRVTAEAQLTGKTGVEMEAMTAASVAALTIYDMCKGVEKGIVIEAVRLLSKSGGKSGLWLADSETDTD